MNRDYHAKQPTASAAVLVLSLMLFQQQLYVGRRARCTRNPRLKLPLWARQIIVLSKESKMSQI